MFEKETVPAPTLPIRFACWLLWWELEFNTLNADEKQTKPDFNPNDNEHFYVFSVINWTFQEVKKECKRISTNIVGFLTFSSK